MRFVIILVAFCIAALPAHSQVLPYLFQVDNQTYVPLENAISITGNDNWQDPDYLIDIGFDFYGFGQYNNQMTFGGVFGYGGELFLGAFDGTEAYPHLCPYGLDIQDPNTGTNEPPAGSILMKVEGDEPNRICKLEWKNVGFFLDETGTMRANFQMWLYETTNNIEFRYGPTENFSLEPLLELNGILVGISNGFNFNEFTFNYFWTLDGEANDPSLVAYDSFSLELQVADHIMSQPENGTVYRFVNLEVNVEELLDRLWVVFPCPAKDAVQVKFLADQSSKDFYICDIAGQTVVKGQLHGGQDEIKVNDLAPGMYCLVVNTFEGVVQKSIVVE